MDSYHNHNRLDVHVHTHYLNDEEATEVASATVVSVANEVEDTVEDNEVEDTVEDTEVVDTVEDTEVVGVVEDTEDGVDQVDNA